MNLEPPHLGVPLYRRDWSAVLFALASAALGWLWHRPTALAQILISCLVGGLVFWLVLGPGLHRFRQHRSRAVRAAVLFVSIIGGVFVMQFVVPALHAVVARAA
jgi:hypothetical protein